MRCLALVALAACGDPSSTPPDASAAADAAACAPGNMPATAYVTSIVGALAATPRYTSTDRQAARTYLLDQLAQLQITSSLFSYATGADVVGTLPASTASKGLIVVGAHFDTVSASPGANDNATGVAAVLAVARTLRDMTCRSADVSVVLFDEEETGLYGARAYADMLVSTNAHVLAVHTIDQVGWDSNHNRRYEIELPTATLEQEYRAAAAAIGVPVTPEQTSGTDHQAFRDRGFAAVGVTEEYVEGDTSPYRHTAQDTPSTVDNEYNAIGAQLAAQVLINELAP